MIQFLLILINIVNGKYFRLTQKQSGLVVDCAEFEGCSLSDWNGYITDDQLFEEVDAGNGYIYIVQKSSGLALEGGVGSVTLSTIMDGFVFQEWKVQIYNDSDGIYNIYYNQAFNYVLDGQPGEDGVVNDEWSWSDSQLWKAKTVLPTTTTTTISPKTTTTTTSRPIEDCLFYSNDGNHVLNLTEWKGQILARSDPKNNSLIYAITPCNNSLVCNNQNVNTYLYDLSYNKCNKYLSIWNDDIIPKYDMNDKIWQFIYMNGEECNGLTSDLEVYWQCDQTMSIPEIVYVDEEYECTYSIHINSSAACF